jgi:hypothetical protein
MRTDEGSMREMVWMRMRVRAKVCNDLISNSCISLLQRSLNPLDDDGTGSSSLHTTLVSTVLDEDRKGPTPLQTAATPYSPLLSK